MQLLFHLELVNKKENFIMIVKGTKTETIELNVNKLDVLISMFQEAFLGYHPINDLFLIEDNKIYMYYLDKTSKYLLYEDAQKVEEFNHLTSLIEMYKEN